MFELGGVADKLGNEYERRWVVRQLLRLLDGEIAALTWEPLGNEGLGIELLTEQPDGRTDVYQCKGGASVRDWTVTRLATEGVIRAIHSHLSSDLKRNFYLVTANPATALSSLTERARALPIGDTRFTQGLSASVQRELTRFCELANVGVAAAHELLSRTYVSRWASERFPFDELRSLVQLRIDGDPSLAIAGLADFAVQRLGQRVSANEVAGWLESAALPLFRLSGNPTLMPALLNVRHQYFDAQSRVLTLCLTPRNVPRS